MNKPGSVARVAPSVKINSGKSSWEVSKAEVIDSKLVAGEEKKRKKEKKRGQFKQQNKKYTKKKGG
jgi:hypothetical protein